MQAAVIDWAAWAIAVEVSLRVTLDKTARAPLTNFHDAARLVPEVLKCRPSWVGWMLRLSVIARDMAHYQHLYRNHILTLPHIADIEALMQVARIKTNESLPI